MITENFNFLSANGKTQIHAVRWIPDDRQYHSILQITHGMIEFIERYEKFAEFMTSQGYLVVGHDHLGHGQSVTSEAEWGYIGEPSPSDLLVADMHKLRTITQEEHPNLPYFMLAHSMGSYMIRKYLYYHNENLSGAIIMGTGFMPAIVPITGKIVVKTMSIFKSWHYRSKMVQSLSFDKPYKRYDLTGANAANSWLTKDEEIVKWYYADPRCTFSFTINGYQSLFEAVQFDCKQSTVNGYRKDLPLFIVSGADDPVGNMGIGVKKVYDMMKKAEILDVTYKLYEHDRHEILNETDKEVVYSDILAWLEVHK